MEQLVHYASSSDDESDGNVHAVQPATTTMNQSSSSNTMLSLPTINSAPLVVVANPDIASATAQFLTAASQTQLAVNLPIEATLAPYYGPEHAGAGRRRVAEVGAGKEIVTGVVEATNMEDLTFEAQYHTYNQTHSGTRRNRQRSAVSSDAIVALDSDNVFTQRTTKRRKPIDPLKVASANYGDDAVDSVWAPFAETPILSDAAAGTMSAEQTALHAAHAESKRLQAEKRDAVDDDMAFDRLIEKKIAHLLPARLTAGQEAKPATSTFVDLGHEYDYQGRAWTEPPRTLKPDVDRDHAVYLPKRCIHTWAGHTKGVQAIELTPEYGHLLLSGSMDHTVRIWDVYNERKCKRIYDGHSGAVRAINFATDSKHFLSAGFDRFLQLWDTETGQSIQSFTNRRVPYCIKFYPDGTNSNFVIGDSNNMVVQFDARTGGIVQEYNHHLQAVNSVTFVDDNRRFVSTSDDKKILVWEWGIPVPIKYISEPTMHSMPAVTLHPSGQFFAGQALNNEIDVYAARDKFKRQRKKVFKGHSSAGYACQIGFSPNGQYIMSGDAEGRLVFWDWKTTKMYKKLRAHDRGPCIGAVWHPLEPSKVVSCGWDGLIKYWD